MNARCTKYNPFDEMKNSRSHNSVDDLWHAVDFGWELSWGITNLLAWRLFWQGRDSFHGNCFSSPFLGILRCLELILNGFTCIGWDEYILWGSAFEVNFGEVCFFRYNCHWCRIFLLTLLVYSIQQYYWMKLILRKNSYTITIFVYRDRGFWLIVRCI